MLAAITAYLQNGDYHPHIFAVAPIKSMIENNHPDSEFLSQLIASREASFDFLKAQPGFIGFKWFSNLPGKCYHIGYYQDEVAFNNCHNGYKLDNSVANYKDLKNDFLRKFNLEYIEYGTIDVESDNLTVPEIEGIITGKSFKPWPKEFSYSDE